ncbi:MAG: thymidine phosphorylase [Candidatus Eiseniibacteriota bacterium]
MSAALDPRAFLREKREGREHAAGAIGEFIARAARREIPDYQVSAWLMAAFLRGLSETETTALTQAMTRSGRVFDWGAIFAPAADKHSTGGIGDKISLVLAPLAACCGVCVPMVSGRGLGHTGGTLDKLESIPGFRTALSADAMLKQLQSIGVFMAGQGPDLAPADGLLYALRDVTSTVEFQPFIVSSIVSKKIAEGARTVVYDVKCGSGAFMRTLAEARTLAERLVAATRAMGAGSNAFVTDMSWPIGTSVGNALEVAEAVAVLKGGGPADTRELSITLAAEMVRLAGAETKPAAARSRVENALAKGVAFERFRALVAAQGGEAGALERTLHPAPEMLDVTAQRSGYLAACDGFALGELVVAMGGGRRRAEDPIDPRVGLTMLKRHGAEVRGGEAFARVHAARRDAALAQRAAACFEIHDTPPAARAADLVIERVG